MSFLKRLFSSAYDELWKAVIRPNRDKYFDFELGPEKFELKGKCYKRTDFTLRNKKNNKLVCSFWEPFDEEREHPKLPCVIYLHGNSSSRCEVVPEIKYLLKKGITVFAFDFSGCGRSEGEYISLGWHEQDDVACVVDFLRRSNKVSTIGLWGRSMGAATALMYSTKDLSIAGLVLDSPFSSLKSLINELAKDRVNLPDFVVKQAIKWIKETIKEKAGFNLDDVEPKDYAPKCFIPAYFCHSKEDTFVNIHHCKDLYNLYAGDKNIVYVKGNHNSERSIHFRDSVAQFFYKALRCEEMEQRYEFNKIYNFEFYYDDNNFCKNIVELKNKSNKLRSKKLNNSVSEIKIRGKIENKKDINNNNKNDKDIIVDDSEVYFPNEDNIFIHEINVCPKLKTNSEFNDKLFNINNKRSRKQFFHVHGPKLSSSQNQIFSKTINEDQILNKEDENINKNLNLTAKELEDVSIKSPNYLKNNNKFTIKRYNKDLLSFLKLKQNNKCNEVDKESNENISFENKYRLLTIENQNNINKSVKEADQNNINIIFYVKDMKRRRNSLLKNLKNKDNIKNNSITNKNKIFNHSKKRTSVKPVHALIKYPKPSSPELNFESLMQQIKKNNNNLKDINKSININKSKMNQIYKIINNNKGNLKQKLNKKEESKNISKKNDTRTIFKNTNNKLIKLCKIKGENSKCNNNENSKKVSNNKSSNNINFFQENDDDFFLEEDSIKINIPHI